ncbi:CMRF35-like molecule 5 isoform X3 [Dermochelys coriacea]|uniref:CMRF35-like molecule 5 isoform X3 n=1 Tax=Dermochelys coriacea TaxID=27794 RepID=UPI0018E78F0F|nr:CMRF35-like molecule 5 isoform X3 [Dermochelys coriacea]
MGHFPARLFLLALTGLCIAGKDLELVRRVQGGALTTVCHYNEHKYSRREKFWCKELSDLKCRTLVLSSPAAGRNSLNPPKARVSLKDTETGWISVSMTELQVEDSGIYWCGLSDDLKIIPLKKIKVAVSYEESYDRTAFVTTSPPIDNIGAILPTAARNDQQSWYSEVSLNVLYIIAGLLGTKFLTVLLIFIVASNRRSKATEQEIHGRKKHHLLPLTGLKKGKENTSKTRI